MKRYLLPFVLAFGSAAAADELPVPPAPPENIQMTEVAPTPDQDVQAPVPPVSDQPNVNVKLYRSQIYDPSRGFTPGSRYQSTEDRKPIQTPGLSVSVPIR